MQWGAFTIEVAPDGAGFWLLHGEDEWAAFTLEGIHPTGRFCDDPDEVEHGFGSGDLTCSVRHSIGQAWTLRWALSASEPTRLSRPPRLSVSPGTSSVAWAWSLSCWVTRDFSKRSLVRVALSSVILKLACAEARLASAWRSFCW